MFRKVLIANRGEIAVRIIATLREMGIATVAVCSEPDRCALHVQEADEVVYLGGTTSAESYLRIDAILEAARLLNVDAIHPGYGFLSENAGFAQRCMDAGITFIGPTPHVIGAMGDKLVAKRMMAEAGVPVVPGFEFSGNESPDEIQREATRIGFPILVKAAAGGGGKGMRRVDQAEDLIPSVEAATREAGSAFGDGRVFLEKYISSPRHIEFQIFGDQHGRAVHLCERECSIQRRYQKIIEESPSVALNADLRERMGMAAVKAAEAIGYTNAGTVEFILAETGEFYFLEVNTRLQVEHPVTESILGFDLVRAQVLVAAGQPLPFEASRIAPRGHAIECRIYAEDPWHNFMPSTGRLTAFDMPRGPGIRVDTGFREGDEVSTYYDPMLAKLIVWGEDRQAAIRRSVEALRRFAILGLTTNVSFLRRILEHEAFQAGQTDTHFLNRVEIVTDAPDVAPDEVLAAAALLSSRGGSVGRAETGADALSAANADGPWSGLGAWRGI